MLKEEWNSGGIGQLHADIIESAQRVVCCWWAYVSAFGNRECHQGHATAYKEEFHRGPATAHKADWHEGCSREHNTTRTGTRACIRATGHEDPPRPGLHLSSYFSVHHADNRCSLTRSTSTATTAAL
jgi:hypothetical protein